MPSPRLDDRIRELCAQAIAADDAKFAEGSFGTPVGVAPTHCAATRNSNAGIRCTKATEPPAGGRTVQTANDSNRIRELIAKIETEQDQENFCALVEELNRLLEGDPSVKKPPSQPPIDHV